MKFKQTLKELLTNKQVSVKAKVRIRRIKSDRTNTSNTTVQMADPLWHPVPTSHLHTNFPHYRIC